MVGKNAAELELPHQLSRLHPVFNVALLMPYISNNSVSPPVVPPIDNSFPGNLVDWAACTYVLKYRCLAPNVHEYLICGTNSLGLNNKWRLLTTLSSHLDVFLWQFHH